MNEYSVTIYRRYNFSGRWGEWEFDELKIFRADSAQEALDFAKKYNEAFASNSSQYSVRDIKKI